MQETTKGSAAPVARGPSEAIESALRASLGDVRAHPVPIGYAVATAFRMPDGDALAVYLSGPLPDGTWVLVDDGGQVPLLVASGFTGTGADAVVDRLVRAHGARLDREAMEVQVGPVADAGVGEAATRLVAVLLGLSALSLTDWTPR